MGVLELGNGGGCNTILEFSAAAEGNRQAVWGHDWPVFSILKVSIKKITHNLVGWVKLVM